MWPNSTANITSMRDICVNIGPFSRLELTPHLRQRRRVHLNWLNQSC
jgi:hypothetical protein